ncbi:OLC1v1035674C1 [Oldenlandia corymbosa var. corymbosa]|uniref:OLC1v1035674C1 n=1 Tax=Oldenlandia corymbosa var. corymbosa TaxID=529605 RepID=A0AAV1CTL4_OLDCO|nr:OLC1v1035674C1 [Oldenlandia corymbosa var. corymbosa]
MAKETLISHTQRLIFLRPSPSNSDSDEFSNRNSKTQLLVDYNSNSATIPENAGAGNEDLDTTFRRLHLRERTGPHFLSRAVDEEVELNFISPGKEYVDSMVKTVSDFKNSIEGFKMLGFHSCNGLVAIALKNHFGGVFFYVYNPTTCHRRLLPQLYARVTYFPKRSAKYDCPMICPQASDLFVDLNIAYDPLKSDNYRVVYVWYDDWWFRVAIYASETGDWLDANCNLDYYSDIIDWKGILWNGDLHWVSSKWFTICLDIENGCEKHIPAILPKVAVCIPEDPQSLKSWPEIIFFGVSGGDLCLIGLKEPKSFLFDVFVMELDYSCWNVKYCLDLSPLGTLYPLMVCEENDPHNEWFRCKLSVLCCADEKGEEPELLISLPGKIVSFDTKAILVKEIADVAPETTVNRLKDLSRFKWSDAF